MIQRRLSSRGAAVVKVRTWLNDRHDPALRRRWERWLHAPLTGVIIVAGLTIWQVDSQLDAGREQQRHAFAEQRAQQAQADEDARLLEIQRQRRPIYEAFLDALGTFVSDHERRNEECRRGTDLPKPGAVACTVGYLSDLQSSRYQLRGADNSMSTVESEDMSVIRGLMHLAIPSSTPRDGGPAEGPVRPSYGRLYVVMLDQMRCDTNPTVLASECVSLVERGIRALGNDLPIGGPDR